MTPILNKDDGLVLKPKVPKKRRATILRPPPGQMVLICTMQNDTTIWYVGPLTELEFQTHHEPILSWESPNPLYTAGHSEVAVRGFRPETSGRKPLRTTKWPTPPKPPKPAKPRTLRQYSAEELVGWLTNLAKEHEQHAQDDDNTTEEQEKLQGRIDAINKEILRRLGPTKPFSRRRKKRA